MASLFFPWAKGSVSAWLPSFSLAFGKLKPGSSLPVFTLHSRDNIILLVICVFHTDTERMYTDFCVIITIITHSRIYRCVIGNNNECSNCGGIMICVCVSRNTPTCGASSTKTK